jgi:hypothetical protein
MQRRRRFKQASSLRERLAEWAKEVREQAAHLPPGPDREALLKKARQADTASELDDWANRLPNIIGKELTQVGVGD